MRKITGTFDVSLTPQTAPDAVPGRFSIDKQFHGGLQGTSLGEMLVAMTVQGSGGYVALEKVAGTLEGRSGGFILQHNGTSVRGQKDLLITVLPDSGTGELEGLTGKMHIEIDDGKHDYEFDYNLPSAG
jgi:hypothetical protein